jgi:hypothetical protein
MSPGTISLQSLTIPALIRHADTQLQGVDPLTLSVDQNIDVAMEPRHLPHPLDGPFRLHQRAQNTGDTDERDGERIVVVIVDGPEEDGGDLEDVEWVEDFIDCETEERLGFNVDDVHAHQYPALLACAGIKALRNDPSGHPFGITPISAAVSASPDRSPPQIGLPSTVRRPHLIIAQRPVPGSRANLVYRYSITLR